MAEEAGSATPESSDPAAVALALAGASREEADAYLRDQRHHLHEQLKQIHLDLWEKRLGVLLRVATAVVGIAVAAALGAIPSYARNLGVPIISDPLDLISADAERQDWQQIIAEEAILRARIAQEMDSASRARARDQSAYDALRPWFAFAEAKLGDFKAAEALIAPAPPDDDQALRMRGLIAETEGQHERADWWFARAEARAPHIPFADEMWGQALLARGQPDKAIAKFKLSNRKGPHFADPLEGWGEALMARNRSDLALAKFEEADKYAPNWGRLHLKWGEALYYAGKKDDAAKQFARAASLDLTPAEKADLAAMSHG